MLFIGKNSYFFFFFAISADKFTYISIEKGEFVP